MSNICGRHTKISESSENSCANRYITNRNHTMSFRDPKKGIWDNTYPFWTCHPSGNLVDGLPLAIHRKFRCKILDDAYIYRETVRVNFGLPVLPHIDASKLASERSNSLDHRRVISIPNFRKCWRFLVEHLKLLKLLKMHAWIHVQENLTKQWVSETLQCACWILFGRPSNISQSSETSAQINI